MKDHNLKKPVYEMSPEELKELLRPIADDVLQKKWDNNGYITYYDKDLCPSPDVLVHEYRDHRELVRIDDNGKATFFKNLNDEKDRTTSANDYSGAQRRG